jgi:hypothetical protein
MSPPSIVHQRATVGVKVFNQIVNMPSSYIRATRVADVSCRRSEFPAAAPEDIPLLAIERILIAWNHAIYKDSLKINMLEHVLVEKVYQLF